MPHPNPPSTFIQLLMNIYATLEEVSISKSTYRVRYLVVIKLCLLPLLPPDTGAAPLQVTPPAAGAQEQQIATKIQ